MPQKQVSIEQLDVSSIISAIESIRSIGSPNGALSLYTETLNTPASNAVTGSNAVAIGEGNYSSGTNSVVIGVDNAASALGAIALGNSANALFPGQFAHAAGKFGIIGDAQGSEYIYRGQTITQYPIEIFLDGVSSRLVLTDNSAIAFEALAIARRTDIIGTYAAFKCQGLIVRNGGLASTTIVGGINKTIITKSHTSLDVNFAADATNGSLKVTVTGARSQAYNWVVKLTSVEEIG